MCKGCANKDTDYCLICTDDDMYRTKEQKEYEDYMCEMMCGGVDGKEQTNNS